MLINYQWLQDFIKEDLPPADAIAEALSVRSFEVERLDRVGIRYPGVVVGYVEDVQDHPNADRLKVCKVDVGENQPLQIVCGAKNVAVGQYVPVAKIGAVLGVGTEIQKVALRGVDSEGMICSKVELGESGESDGIWVLEGDYKPGTLFDEVMQSGVVSVFDIDILPNRAHDCLSHRGVATEVAAVFELTFIDHQDSIKTSKDPKELSVSVSSSSLCRRYMGVYITGIEVKETPEWIKDRLLSVGQRLVSPVVDIANYVMFSVGQPLHTFDALELVKDGEGVMNIEVRDSLAGEDITLLGGEEVSIPERSVVISDASNPDKPAVAIAGIKGGEKTSVTENTDQIVLEAAVFDPVSVRKTAQAMKIATDSSKRFENDISAGLAQKAVSEFIRILKENSASDLKIRETVDVYPEKEEVPEIEVEAGYISNLLGVDISSEELESVFKRLRFSFSFSGGRYKINPPMERRDLGIPSDIAEEVGRIYGYEQVKPKALNQLGSGPQIDAGTYFSHLIKDVLVEEGFSEVVTYALRSRGEYEIENPLAQDKRYFRDCLEDGLKIAKKENSRFVDLLGIESVLIFEIGSVYKDGAERLRLGIAVEASKGKKTKPQEYIDKALEKLSSKLGVEIARKHSLSKEAGVFECDLEVVVDKLGKPGTSDDFKDTSREISYKPVSVYPYVLRDVAVWTPENISAKEVSSIIERKSGELLVNHYLFDEYRKDNRVSYAFRLVFQSDEKTLSDDEVGEIMEGVYEALDSRADWSIR